jgi:hypothetical protein
MLMPDMKQIIEETTPQIRGDGRSRWHAKRIAEGHLHRVERPEDCVRRNPLAWTIRNLRVNPRIEVNFVDPFVRKGYRFAGTATRWWRDGTAEREIRRSWTARSRELQPNKRFDE